MPNPLQASPVKYNASTRKFIAGVATAAIITEVVLLSQYTPPKTWSEWGLLVIFTALFVATNYYSLSFSGKINLQLSTVVAVASVLLFPTAAAVLCGAMGKAISSVLRRKRLEQLAFNTSQVVIYTSISSLTLNAFNPAIPWKPGNLQSWAGMILAVSLIMVINILLTGTFIAIEGHQPLRVSWMRVGKVTILQDPAQVSLGILSALLLDRYPWALVFISIPVVMLYHALRRERQVEEQRQQLMDQNNSLVTSLQEQTSQLQSVISELETALEANRRANLSLELEIAQRMIAQRNLASAYDDLLQGLTHALELRDQDTEGHSQRVTRLTVDLAHQVGIAENQIGDLWRGALLHDLGKIGIPDAILNNPGELNAEEMAIMQRHPVYAFDLLRKIEYLRDAIDIPYCHHERWDGSGYPRGLKGEEIPLAARIFAVVDVWDALRSNRPYRQAWTDESAWKYIKNQSGKQFDPRVVEAFIRYQEMLAEGSAAAQTAVPKHYSIGQVFSSRSAGG